MNEWKQEHSGLVSLMVCSNELEAQTIRAVLKDSGIPAFVFEKGGLGIGLALSTSRIGGVQIQVPADRLVEAQNALKLVEVDSARIDWSEIDVGELPEEVSRTLATRGFMHGFRYFVVTIGPIIGLGLLFASVIGAIIILWF